MTVPVRAAFVGTGWWGTMVAEAASRTGGAIEAVLGCGLDEAERAAFGRRFGCAATGEFDRVLADPSIEAVVLATPHLLHLPQIEAAAGAGKHILVEKPLATTLADALAAVEAARAAGVVLAVGHNRRLLSQVASLREIIAGGELGPLLHVEANFSTAEAMAFPEGHWRASRAQCPGGAMTVLGVHVIDWMHHLFGDVATVSAAFSHRAAPADMDDVATARLAFASGLTGTLTCLYSAPYANRFVIHGARATVAVVGLAPESEAARPTVTITQASGESAAFDAPFVDSLALQLTRFAGAIRDGAPVAVTGEEGARNVAVLDAMARSAAAEGATRTVDYGPLRA